MWQPRTTGRPAEAALPVTVSLELRVVHAAQAAQIVEPVFGSRCCLARAGLNVVDMRCPAARSRRRCSNSGHAGVPLYAAPANALSSNSRASPRRLLPGNAGAAVRRRAISA
jgi:hypothetical protein